MHRFSFVTVDVFTDRRFGGNPLAVFPDAQGLGDADMQSLAAEFNLSETTFVLPPADDEIAALAPMVDLIHLKDRDFKARRTVPLGDGGVPWADELKRLLSGVRGREVVASMETHCPQDGRNATAKSVAALRRIAGEIGVKIV